MALEIRRDASVKVRVISTLVMAFALVMQPMYGFVSSRVANAATVVGVVTTTNQVVINEILSHPTTGQAEWVELYNTTNAAIDISGWQIKTGNRVFANIDNSQPLLGAHSHFVTEATNNGTNLSNDGQTLSLLPQTGNEPHNTLLYPALSVGQSYGRSPDGSANLMQFSAAQVSRGNSNHYVAPVILPQLNAENFNTVDANYKGISVGFNAKDFGTVSSVTVDVTRADGSHVIKNGNQGVYDLISNKTTSTQLTAPIVIQEGTYTEASDTLFWDTAPAVWNTNTRPTSVLISVTDNKGVKTITNGTFSEGAPSWPTYESLLPPAPAEQVEVVVRGNTSAGENQPGWAFNRDPRNVTPYAFVNANPSVGNGSIYVKPITNTVNGNADKFVAENFLLSPIKDINSISYDYQIGNGGDVADDAEFYMNVYANFGSSDANKFYDCRYDVVPTIGSTASYTKVTFDLTQPHTVATRTGASAPPIACPAKPADMEILSPGSTIRMFSLNVGGTSASDTGLDGYLDNVIVNTKSTITTYDFEAELAPAAPANLHFTSPALACNAHTNSGSITANWSAVQGATQYLYHTEYNGNVYEEVKNGTSHSGGFPTEATYTFKVKALSASGAESAWSDTCSITYDKTLPTANISSPLNGAVIKSNSLQVTGVAHDQNFAFYKLYIMQATAEQKYKTQVVADGNLGAPIDISNLVSGEYKLRLHVKDEAGNSGDDYATFTIDRTKPVVTGSMEASYNPASFTITATDNVAVKTVTGNIYNASNDVIVKGNSSSTSPFTVNLSALTDGNYYVKYNAADTAGNISNTERFYFTVDRTAPNITVDTLTTTKDRSPTITGTIDDVDANVFVTIDGQDAKQATIDNVHKTWSYTVTESLEFGNHTVSAKAIDGVGNEGTTNAKGESAVIAFVVERPSIVAPGPIDGDGNNQPANPGNNQGTTAGADGRNVTTSGSTFSPLQTPSSIFFAQVNGNGVEATSEDDDTDDTAVLGTQSNNNDKDIKGASDTVAALETSDEGWKFLGVPWYWLALLIGAVASIWYLFARRRNQDV